MLDFDVDFVMPYVNNQDPRWKKTFINFCKTHKEYADKLEEIDGGRFRDDYHLFELNFEMIKLCLPFVRKIHLIVSNMEQIPVGIESGKLNIVLHKDIMPESILPTFNSSVIEMFIGNIPDLAEHFIYGNDDMIPLKVMSKEDFFADEKTCKMDIYPLHDTTIDSLFREMVERQYRETFKGTEDYLGDDYYLRPEHSIAPYFKSVVQDTYKIFKDRIEAHLEPFRRVEQYNQYIYMYQQLLREMVIPSPIKFRYVKMGRPDFIQFCINIANKEGSPYGIICVNDDDNNGVLYDRDARMKLIINAIKLCKRNIEEKENK